MTFLSSGELSQLRDDLETLMPDTCNILRDTITSDKGHISNTPGTAATGVACRFDPLARTADGLVASQDKNLAFYRVTVPYDTDIQDGDYFTFGSDTYQMVQLHDDHSARACRRVTVVKKG